MAVAAIRARNRLMSGPCPSQPGGAGEVAQLARLRFNVLHGPLTGSSSQPGAPVPIAGWMVQAATLAKLTLRVSNRMSVCILPTGCPPSDSRLTDTTMVLGSAGGSDAARKVTAAAAVCRRASSAITSAARRRTRTIGPYYESGTEVQS